MPRFKIDRVAPSEHDVVMARKARQALEREEASGKALRIQVNSDGHDFATLDLPPMILRLLMDILRETAAGNAVSLVPVQAEVTTNQAANILNVSRPFVIGLVESGALAARMVGAHRRLPLRDVLAYKAENFAKRGKVLDELVAYDQALGLE